MSNHSSGNETHDFILNYTVRTWESSYHLIDGLVGGYIHREDRLLRNYHEGRIGFTKFALGSYANGVTVGVIAAPAILTAVLAPEVKAGEYAAMSLRLGTMGAGGASSGFLGLLFEDTFNWAEYDEDFHSKREYVEAATNGFVAGVVFGGLDLAFRTGGRGSGTAEHVVENTAGAEARTAPLASKVPRSAAPGGHIVPQEGLPKGYLGSERQLSAAPDFSAARGASGTVTGGEALPKVTGHWLRGQGNAGLVPRQIADKLRGRTFIDEFREAFWTEVRGESNLANQFSRANQSRMAGRLSPRAPTSQQLGGQSHMSFTIENLFNTVEVFMIWTIY